MLAVLVVAETWSKLCVHSTPALCHWGGRGQRRSKKPWELQQVRKIEKILLVVAL